MYVKKVDNIIRSKLFNLHKNFYIINFSSQKGFNKDNFFFVLCKLVVKIIRIPTETNFLEVEKSLFQVLQLKIGKIYF